MVLEAEVLELQANLSTDEQRWLSDYTSTVFKYQSAFGENGVNLLDGVKPPQALHVFVGPFSILLPYSLFTFVSLGPCCEGLWKV